MFSFVLCRPAKDIAASMEWKEMFMEQLLIRISYGLLGYAASDKSKQFGVKVIYLNHNDHENIARSV